LVDSIGDDGHSRYLSPDEWTQEQSSLQGQFEGIGAEVQMKDNRPVIVAPLEGSPAQQAGLQPGDIILRVEGADTAELSLDEVVRRIRGNAGTSVTITILRPSTNQTQDLTITRQPVKLQPAT